MSLLTGSKVAHTHRFLGSNDLTDLGDEAKQVSHRQSFQESCSVNNSISDHTLHSSVKVSDDNLFHSTDHCSVIIQTNGGFLYPIQRSIRSPQIEIFQHA